MKGESLTKKILTGLLIGGAVFVAASSPYFSFYLSRNLYRALKKRGHLKVKNSQFDNAFYYLKRKGYLDIGKRNKQIYFSLTEEGRKKAKKYLIDDLEIKKPKSWDRRWRIVIFDIPNIHYLKREAFRGKIKELGFLRLQQSVWVTPYECEKEIKLLRDFFGLSSRELKLIVTERLEDDESLRKFFKI